MTTRVTASLLSAWHWSFVTEDGYQRFIKTLSREKDEPSQAMQDGILFEALISNKLQGIDIPEEHEWARAVNQAAAILHGSAEQVRGEAELMVDGNKYLLVGVADNIKAGVIYDTKLSRRYQFGRYQASPQHPAYFALWPLALQFTYLIFDGKDLMKETYYPFDTPPIHEHIRAFRQYLDAHNLLDLYYQHWRIDQ